MKSGTRENRFRGHSCAVIHLQLRSGPHACCPYRVAMFSGRDLAKIRQSLGPTIKEATYLASVTPRQIRYMEEESSDVRSRSSFEIL